MKEKAGKEFQQVTVSFRAGRRPGRMDILSEPLTFRFVLGMGTEGLTPFEFSMGEPRPGKGWQMGVSREEVHETFRHIPIPLPVWPEGEDSLHFLFRVEEVRPAAPREVVKALAEVAACGDQCCGH